MFGARVVVSVPDTAIPECAWASLVSASVPRSATRGDSGAIDVSGSTATGSGSYSTSIRSSASSAIARSSAATAATGWPKNTARSMASSACARVFAPAFNSGMSAAVSTARTPGSARAREASMRLMRACANGLRSSRACSRPGNWTSPTYCVRPVTFSGASNRGTDTPMPRTSRLVFITVVMCSALPHLASRFGDRSDHLRIARAPTQVAGDAEPNLGLGWRRVLGEQRTGRHQHTRYTEPTLRHAVRHERGLHRVEAAARRQTLDGAYVAAPRLHRQHQAARDGLAVQVDRTCATVAGAAALFGTRQPRDIAHRLQQSLVRLHQQLRGLAVDRARQQHSGHWINGLHFARPTVRWRA